LQAFFSTMFTLLILAAGESSRMGSPKALLQIGSETFVECITRKGRESGASGALVVTGASHRELITRMPASVVVVHNTNYQNGQFSSLQEGIRYLPQSCSLALVWPVDLPLVETESITALLDNYQKNSNPLTIPVYGGRKGHPVLYNREALDIALTLAASQTARELRECFLNRIGFVNVEDCGVTIDIDTLEDYRRYIISDLRFQISD